MSIYIYVFASVYLDEGLMNQALELSLFKLRDIWSAMKIPTGNLQKHSSWIP